MGRFTPDLGLSAVAWAQQEDIRFKNPTLTPTVGYKPNLSSRIYSSDGLLLKSFYTEERIFIPENRIPEKVKFAFLSSEDKVI